LQIILNGSLFWMFFHRVDPSQVSHVRVFGDVALYKLTYHVGAEVSSFTSQQWPCWIRKSWKSLLIYPDGRIFQIFVNFFSILSSALRTGISACLTATCEFTLLGFNFWVCSIVVLHSICSWFWAFIVQVDPIFVWWRYVDTGCIAGILEVQVVDTYCKYQLRALGSQLQFEDGDSKGLQNVSNTADIYTLLSAKNKIRVQISFF
jgi:hypothetical protein